MRRSHSARWIVKGTVRSSKNRNVAPRSRSSYARKFRVLRRFGPATSRDGLPAPSESTYPSALGRRVHRLGSSRPGPSGGIEQGSPLHRQGLVGAFFGILQFATMMRMTEQVLPRLFSIGGSSLTQRMAVLRAIRQHPGGPIARWPR